MPIAEPEIMRSPAPKEMKRTGSHIDVRSNHLSDRRLKNLDFPEPKLNRPMSAARTSCRSDMASHMSFLPEADRFTLVNAANQIFQNRQKIRDQVQVPSSKLTLRDVCSSSKIFSILKKAGIPLELIALKQLLRELGFPFNGPACSFTSLMTACKAMLHGKTREPIGNVVGSERVTEFSGVTPRANIKIVSDAQRTCETLRDVFYTSGKTLYDLFKIGMSGKTIDKEGFTKICEEVGAGLIPASDLFEAFNLVAKNGRITFTDFEKAFKSEIPTGLDFDTKVIRQVREWMFQNGLGSEAAFDMLCRSIGLYTQKRMDRACFHRAFTVCEVGLSAAKIDSLFSALVAEANGEIDLNSWLARIYEDQDNPIQMIREIVLRYGLSQEDLLFQMKLKVWDDPLSLSKLKKAINSMDQSLSDSQINAIFKTLKDSKGVVPVPTLISNFTGQPYETVDYRNNVYKKIYAEVYPEKEDQLVQLLADQDQTNMGRISSKALMEALSKVCANISREMLERFVRQIETDKIG